MKKLLLFLLLFSIAKVRAQKQIKLLSPDKNIEYKFKFTKKDISYQVAFKGNTFIEDSKLSLSFAEGGDFGADLRMLNHRINEVDETYDLVVGKTSTVKNRYRQLFIPLVENSGLKRQINLVVRTFNEGVAFRYEFPVQRNWPSYTLTNENTTFKITGNPVVRSLMFGSYNTSHEGFYQKLSLKEIKQDTLMDMPALFEFPDKMYMAITEANLRNYAGMYLTKHHEILTSQLSPLQGQTEIKVKAMLPHHTPWRVIMLSDRMGTLIESNMLTSLCEPTKFTDVSWIKPGKTSFHWWNGDVTPDTTFAPGINFETNKYYIDFCARNNIDYHSVIGYGGFAWYKSDAPGYSEVGPNTDVTQTVPTLDMQKVCDYAKQKGVGIHVWVNWKAIYPDLDKAFAQFQKWGIKGMMVDFLNRDDQEMVNIQEEILEKAAQYKLFIQFHGAYKPTGLNRTYPNEFTREGTLNYEMNKFRKEGLSPDHDINMPFIRMLAGAADYHLGGFRAVPPSKFKTQFTRPLMIGTRCHMLAMYVVLESYLNMVADYPASYEGQDGFEFLQKVPTVWEEVKVINAKVDEYITIARRKGDEWFIGTITNNKARELNIPLEILSEGDYVAEIYADGPEASGNPNDLVKETITVNRTNEIKAKLSAGGGHVIHLFKK